MASPFRVFRKHQKILIATLGLLAMIAFVFLSGPVLDYFMAPPSRNAVVVSTSAYGDLRRSDMAALMQQRQVLLSLFEQILAEGGLPPRITRIAVEREFGPAEERAVVNTWLMAEKADQIGMVMDDRELNAFLQNFLQQYTQARVSPAQVATLLGKRGISEAAFFAALQRELLARKLIQTFQPSALGSPPLERWQFYRQLNQQAEVELLPLPVERFMDEVDVPGDAELREFFNEYKDVEWRPDTPTPGFRQPERVALTYFKADYDDFADPASIPDDEVRRYYEQTKDTLYRREGAERASDPNSRPQDGAPEQGEPDQPADAPEAQSEGGPSQEETPAEGASGEGNTPDGAPSESSSDATAEPSTNPSSDESSDDSGEDNGDTSDSKEQEPSPEDASAIERAPRMPVHLASFAEGDDTDPGQEDAEQDDGTNQSEGAEEEAEQGDESTETQTRPTAEASRAEDTDTDAEPDTNDEPDAEEATAEGTGTDSAVAEEQGSDGSATEDPVPAEPTAEQPQSPYRPLEEVEDSIRQFLASRQAGDKMTEVLGELQSRIRRYYDDLTLYQVEKEEGEATDLEPPTPLDFAALAKEHGLGLYETDLISAWEARTLDIADATVQNRPFIPYVFGDLSVHRPELGQDPDRNMYLFWIDKKAEPSTPEWSEEMREQVAEAWKLVHARKLAREAAGELAERAREDGKSLAEVAPEGLGPASEAGPFSWLSYGNVPPSMARGLPSLGEVKGVEFAGDDFMRTVFSLEEGEVGVAMNQPETEAYVVRLKSFEPPRDELWSRFLDDSFAKYQGAAARQQIDIIQAWRDELQAEAGLKWEIPPETRQ